MRRQKSDFSRLSAKGEDVAEKDRQLFGRDASLIETDQIKFYLYRFSPRGEIREG
jgi:hypothetical protein